MIPTQLERARDLTLDIPEDFDTACMVVRKLEGLHTNVEASGIEIRFHLGRIVRSIGTERGKGTIDKMSEETGVAATTLRIARRFADKFDGDVERMRDWARNHKSSGHKLNWQAVIDLTAANRDPNVLGPTRLIKRLLASIERSVADLTAAGEAIHALPEEDKQHWLDQLEGVANLLVDEATDFRHQTLPVLSGMEVANEGGLFFQPARSRDYLDWLHDYPCAITGTTPVDCPPCRGRTRNGTESIRLRRYPTSTRTSHGTS